MRPTFLIIFILLSTICMCQNIQEKGDNLFVKHLDLITGEEEILKFDKIALKEILSSTTPSSELEIPILNINSQLKSLKLLGTYTQVNSFPESAIVYLLNDLNDLYYTGTLINSKYVLTSGADIYSARDTLDRLYVTSYNYMKGFETRIITWATDVYFFTTVWDSEHVRDNIALVKLNRPIGAVLGYMGYGFQTENEFFEQNNFFVTLIEEITYNLKKYSAKPDVYNDEYFLFQYKEFADGAPFYKDDGILYGINSFTTYLGDYSNPLQNGVARITDQKFNIIKNIIDTNTPTSADIIPLMVSTNPRKIEVLQRLDDISFYLHNFSSATFNGEIRINICLSEDDIIDDNDAIIETYTINTSMPPLKTYRIQPDDKPLIPITIKTGDYFIGASINTNDFNTNNNYTVTYDCDSIHITNNVTAVERSASNMEFSLYPNPAYDFVEITVSNLYNELKVELYDITGIKIREYNFLQNSSTKIDISYLQKGTYILSVSSDSKFKKPYILIKQ